MATHSSILAWKILWTEESGGLQTTGSQKNWHNLVTKTTIKPLLAVHTSDEKFEISFNDMGGSVCKREDLRSERSM